MRMQSLQTSVTLGAMLLGTLFLGACGEADPTPTDTGVDTGADVGTDVGGDTGTDTGSDNGNDVATDSTEDVGGFTPVDDGAHAWDGITCTAEASDYSPGADDTWDACVSDDGTYTQIEENVSSIARVGAFEDIAELLWRNGTPSADDFISARDLYATGEGLDSRVQRREDEHYPPVSDGNGGTLSCRDEGVPAMDPQRCAGPGLILPVLNDAFQRGIAGEEPEVNAARIEAALLWFFYISSFKEGTTCATTRKDCDSSWAYYTGGNQVDGGIGLAGYLREQVPTAHAEAFNGVLAVRCWRDLDPADAAEDLDMQALALSQLDTAMMYGLSRLLAERLADMTTSTGAEFDAHWAFLQVLGPVLDREALDRDPTVGAELSSFWASDGPVDSIEVESVLDQLSTVFPCP